LRAAGAPMLTGRRKPRKVPAGKRPAADAITAGVSSVEPLSSTSTESGPGSLPARAARHRARSRALFQV